MQLNASVAEVKDKTDFILHFGTPNITATCATSTTLNPVAFMCGTLAPENPTLTVFTTNANGQVVIPNVPGTSTTMTAYMQFYLDDLGASCDTSLSNALQIEFGP